MAQTCYTRTDRHDRVRDAVVHAELHPLDGLLQRLVAELRQQPQEQGLVAAHAAVGRWEGDVMCVCVVSGSAARAGAALGWLVVLAVLRKLRDRKTTGDTAVQEKGKASQRENSTALANTGN